jgi:hypothetical protein
MHSLLDELEIKFCKKTGSGSFSIHTTCTSYSIRHPRLKCTKVWESVGNDIVDERTIFSKEKTGGTSER